MKVLTVIILLICSCQASAGLITFQSDQASYAENDIVTIDVNINDINPMIDFVELDIGFDPLALEFVEDSWLDTSDVFDFGAFGDAFLFTNDTLILQASFLDGITDVLGTSFKLGELQFTALTDLATTSFSSKLVTAIDVNFNNVDPQVKVSEPAGTAVVALLGALFLMRMQKSA
ncbi:hypothetical protein Q4602_21130 [Paraglaciecola chathamensis]|uniref:Cohesin domain-containing protein n=1 Tax=Paraglaciecola agarilytica NO2 TaxID=1125747 RepID=A0ABQ0I0W8_9ALTE|nr:MULTISPECIES: hypothetical protein [Paraglaciecola]MDO6841990.1 hypothetical protein [Paraglaciecola chathamensis]GAC02964.1 hypothetical protein GAGA_0099 [Paraglaciecola agarilytica NO2]